MLMLVRTEILYGVASVDAAITHPYFIEAFGIILAGDQVESHRSARVDPATPV